MSMDELILELKGLNRVDKLRAIQVLVNELAVEEEVQLSSGMAYEIFTPYGNEEAAQVMFEALQAAEKQVDE